MNVEVKCRDFERLVNEQIDAREAAVPELARALEQHASTCPRCGPVALRYRALSRAIDAWSAQPMPAPSVLAASLARDWQTIALPGAPAAPWPSRVGRSPWFRAAAAAVLLLAVGAGLRWGGGGRHGAPARPRSVVAGQAPRNEPNALAVALAEATAATWDLARATSAPAARVGREVLEAAASPEATALLSSSSSLPPEAGSASEVLQDVGEQVNERVEPLSGTARHAFGFLLGTNGG